MRSRQRRFFSFSFHVLCHLLGTVSASRGGVEGGGAKRRKGKRLSSPNTSQRLNVTVRRNVWHDRGKLHAYFSFFLHLLFPFFVLLLLFVCLFFARHSLSIHWHCTLFRTASPNNDNGKCMFIVQNLYQSEYYLLIAA